MATVLYADGTHADLPVPAGGSLSLATMQEVVGGYIEVVTLLTESLRNRRRVLVIDGEGRLKGKPLNRTATDLYRVMLGGDVIVGDAILAEVINGGEHDETWR